MGGLGTHDVVMSSEQASNTLGSVHEVHAAHEQLHRHHMHLPEGRGRRSGTGLIWLLVFLHLGFIGYWVYVYYKQRNRMAAGKKEPEKVNCVYEFAMPTINLAESIRGLGVGQGDKIR